MNNLITQPQGCILQPPHITVDALAAIARSHGAYAAEHGHEIGAIDSTALFKN
jgi:hypothetical protein